jgi:hypothetical protein
LVVASKVQFYFKSTLPGPEWFPAGYTNFVPLLPIMRRIPGNTVYLAGLVLFFLSLLSAFHSTAQLSHGGRPLSFYRQGQLSLPVPVTLQQPSLANVRREDSLNDRTGMPYRCAISVTANLNTTNAGQWQTLDDGSLLWRLRVHVPGALALTGYYDAFYLPEGTSFYLYNPERTKTIGAFTADNNQANGLFATELIPGDDIILEYHQPAGITERAFISLSELAYTYRGIAVSNKSTREFGDSGNCEVNVNCSEGDNWEDEKQGVVRIFTKIGASSYWCSGSLLNNVRNDFTPYLLTADHCGQQATPANLSQWIFYFNYESVDCANPNTEPNYNSLVGAEKKASSGYPGEVTGSDFYLVLLKNKVPDSYNPYYNGWSRENTPSTAGVSIHHPQGDIRKISTYITPTTSTSWTAIPNTHWAVKWTATSHGHGVTEGGSSGSPLFNTNHLIMGTLSGGGASCADPNQADFFGKFSYSWDPPASDSSGELACWLDPDQLNPAEIQGLKPNIIYVKTNFTASRDTLVVGNTVDFYDLSSGEPTQWLWKFEGGEPAQSEVQNPQGIRYNKSGIFDVSLYAANSGTDETLLRQYYITVIPNIYPNPFYDNLFIDVGDNSLEGFTVDAYDVLGRPVYVYFEEIKPNQLYSLRFKNTASGLLYLKFNNSDLNLSRKVMYIKDPR